MHILDLQTYVVKTFLNRSIVNVTWIILFWGWWRTTEHQIRHLLKFPMILEKVTPNLGSEIILVLGKDEHDCGQRLASLQSVDSVIHDSQLRSRFVSSI